MTADKVWGVLRTILAAGGGYVAAKGWLPIETYNEILCAVGVIFVAVWSVASKKAA